MPCADKTTLSDDEIEAAREQLRAGSNAAAEAAKRAGVKRHPRISETTQPESFFTRWERIIKSMPCCVKHEWAFMHDDTPPVVVCLRCGRTDPMPHGDERLDYL